MEKPSKKVDNRLQRIRMIMEADLKSRATIVKTKLFSLLTEVEAHYNKILKFTIDFPDEKIDAMAWDEKEKIMAMADKLFDELNVLEKKLRVLDKEYEIIRTEANDFYGKEIMGKVKPLDDLLDDEAADWWKKND